MRLGVRACLAERLNGLHRHATWPIYSFDITSKDSDPPHWDDPDSHHVLLRQTGLTSDVLTYIDLEKR